MANPLLEGGFHDVDQAGAPGAFVEYLERLGSNERVRERNRRRAEAAGIDPGQRALDVGCGVGFDASLLAELVGPGGHVVGIDASATMVERAMAHFASSGLPLEFRTADAQALPFDDGSFDVVWTERVLVHVADPAAVVREMLRVVRPGGRMVIAEADYHSYMIDSFDLEVARQIVARHASVLRHPDIGRRVRRLCLDAGATKVRVLPEVNLLFDLDMAQGVLLLRELLTGLVTHGAVTGERAHAWWTGLE